jgi:hypothetical protein
MVSFNQILVLVFLFLLFFTDFSEITKKILKNLSILQKIIKKNKK